MRNRILLLITVLAFLPGCATLLDLGGDICNTLVGGSKAGELCANLDNLKADDDSAEEAEAVE